MMSEKEETQSNTVVGVSDVRQRSACVSEAIDNPALIQYLEVKVSFQAGFSRIDARSNTRRPEVHYLGTVGIR